MKALVLILAVLVGTQVNAAKLVCINNAVDKPEMVDYLEIIGLLDSEGLLEVREDQPTIATFVSKRNHVDICRGMNINPDQDPQSPKAGWKTARLDSQAFRIRLERNQETGEVQAIAAIPDRHVTFRHCWFLKEADDDEIVRKKMDELSQIADEFQAEKDAQAGTQEGAEGAK